MPLSSASMSLVRAISSGETLPMAPAIELNDDRASSARSSSTRASKRSRASGEANS